jgi:ABC-type glycerol-3-phosphate transport system permease component
VVGVGKVVKTVVLAAIMIAMLFPIYLMVENSFTPAMAFMKVPPELLPYQFTLANYQKVFALKFLGRWVVNSLFIVVSIVVVGLVTNCAAGYVFAFSKQRWAKVLFWSMMTPMFVTRFVLIISQFLVIRYLHISGTLAVILMPLFWPTGIYLSRNYFQSIPISLIESARMDGASELTVLLRVVMPVSKPLVGASVAFLGMAAMGDYIWAHLNLQIPAMKTYLVGLLQSTMEVYAVKNIGYNLAVGVMLFIPYLIVFSLSSRYFITGLTGGAMKE